MYFIIYEHINFEGINRRINLTEAQAGNLHSLASSGMHDKMSSIRWDLEPGYRVVFYEHGDGTGRTYTISKSGFHEDSDTTNNNFQDCASAWRLVKRASIPELFQHIATHPTTLKYRLNGHNIPAGHGNVFASDGHLQGIQRIDDQHIIITGSAKNEGGYFYIIKWENKISASEEGKVINVVKIKDDFPSIDLDHPSGIQMLGSIVAIGLEYMDDHGRRPLSKIVFYNLKDPAKPEPTGPVIIRNEKTAGTIGMDQLPENILLLVGGTATKTLDFYQSNGKAFDSPDCRFNLFEKSWNTDDKDTTGWVDKNWSDYQSLNILRDADGKIYILAFSYASNNWLDLYALNMEAEPHNMLKKIGKKKIQCESGVSFEYGSGIYYTLSGDKIHLLATTKFPRVVPTAANDIGIINFF